MPPSSSAALKTCCQTGSSRSLITVADPGGSAGLSPCGECALTPRDSFWVREPWRRLGAKARVSCFSLLPRLSASLFPLLQTFSVPSLAAPFPTSPQTPLCVGDLASLSTEHFPPCHTSPVSPFQLLCPVSHPFTSVIFLKRHGFCADVTVVHIFHA